MGNSMLVWRWKITKSVWAGLLNNGHLGLMMVIARLLILFAVTELLLLKNTFWFAQIVFKIWLNFQNKTQLNRWLASLRETNHLHQYGVTTSRQESLRYCSWPLSVPENIAMIRRWISPSLLTNVFVKKQRKAWHYRNPSRLHVGLARTHRLFLSLVFLLKRAFPQDI